MALEQLYDLHDTLKQTSSQTRLKTRDELVRRVFDISGNKTWFDVVRNTAYCSKYEPPTDASAFIKRFFKDARSNVTACKAVLSEIRRVHHFQLETEDYDDIDDMTYARFEDVRLEDFLPRYTLKVEDVMRLKKEALSYPA